MTSITNCTSFPEGNLLDWNSKNWILNSSRATAIEENLDLQDEVCPSLFFVTLYLVVPPSPPPTCFPLCMQVCGNQDLALLPLLLKGGGEAEHVCRFAIEKKSSIFTNLSQQTNNWMQPGGSLPRLHLTLTTNNWTRFAAFSRGEHTEHKGRLIFPTSKNSLTTTISLLRENLDSANDCFASDQVIQKSSKHNIFCPDMNV